MQSSGGAATHEGAAKRPVTLADVRAGRRTARRHLGRQISGLRQRGYARCWRHVGRHRRRARRRGPLQAHPRHAPRRLPRDGTDGRGRLRSAPAAARSPISAQAASSRSGRAARAPSPARAATDAAAVEPTATDCYGRARPYRSPRPFLAGRLPLKAELATAAIAEKLARPLGQSVEQAALGAIKILTHNMVQAIEINSVRRGYDPRDFALVAFGGGGPLFACDIARELGIPAVVMPTAPGLTSALGLLTTDVAYEQSRTAMAVRLDRQSRSAGCRPMRSSKPVYVTSSSLMALSDEDIRLVRFADCRYRGQGYELRTPAPAGRTRSGLPRSVGARVRRRALSHLQS